MKKKMKKKLLALGLENPSRKILHVVLHPSCLHV